MKRILLIMAFALMGLSAKAYDFSAVNDDGKTIYYNITSATAPMTVEVTHGSGYSGSVVIPSSVAYDGNTYSVTSIGTQAFHGSGLTSATIPNSVTTIGYLAFAYSSLTSVTIGNSVTSIGVYAFTDCSSLTSVTIPNSVTSIGDGAFGGCGGLTSVTIGNSVTSIGGSAFSSCHGLTSVTIGNSVSTIGDYAFAYNYNLEQITSNATTPPTVAYYTFDGLSENNMFVAVPCGYASAYQAAPRWNEFTIIDGTVDTVISDSICYGQTYTANGFNASQTGVYTQQIGACMVKVLNLHVLEQEFSYDDNNDNYIGCRITSDTTVEVTYGYNGYNGALVIPSTVTSECGLAYAVTEIDSFAFLSSDLVSIVLPNSLKTIKGYAFYNCDYLTSITIPNSVTNIQGYAFYDSDALTTVTIGNSVDTIGVRVFENCDNLTTVNFNATNCKKIGTSSSTNDVFFNCTSLTTLNIGNNVQYIPPYAFARCTALTGALTIPNSVTDIGQGAFYKCTGLTSAAIPSSMTAFGRNNDTYGIFEECSGLTSVTISNNLVSVGRYAFYKCTGLSAITFPNTLDTIGQFAFSNCSSLTSVTIPNSVTSIGNQAFQFCSGLTSVTIGNSVTTIGEQTFYNCSGLTSATIGNSVTSIGLWAFQNCSGLTSITSNAIVPPNIHYNSFHSSFENVPSNIPIYVPCGTINAYSASNWGNIFSNFVVNGAATADTTFYNAAICYGTTYTDANFADKYLTGTYYINLENANGCDSIVSLSLVVKNPPLQQEICMVSVDDNNHNEVVWKRNEDVAAYNIYKESSQSGQYDLVATIDYDSANTWTDMESNARIRSYGYKVSGVDSCGNESPISSNHKTMHLTINAGQNNSWNLIWTPYEGTSYQTYNIYRATGYYGSFGAMELIGTMPSTNTSYSDFTAPAGAYVYYVVEIMLNEPCTLSKSLASIRSNVATNNPNALADIETGNTLVIYPNPASNKITIDCNDKINNIEIVDVLGKIIYQTKDTTIDVSAFAKGNYFVKVYTEKGVMARKVVVE